MYLVHAKFLPTTVVGLPGDIAALIASCAEPNESVEHVSVHADSADGPVVGLFLLATSLERAEQTAVAVCERAVAAVPELQGWSLVRAEVPLLRESDSGHLMPRTDAASRNPFHPF